MSDNKEQKPFSGALFKNDKGDNANRPDYKGTYTDGQGNQFWVSAWVKDSAKGQKYMSLSMQPKTDQVAAPTVSVSNSTSDESQLPF